MTEPKSAKDYDDVGAQAVLSVLLEIGQVLGAYRDRFVVIGGSVPWLLFPDAEPAHVGTLDIDLSLDAQALGDGDYKNLVESLEAAGYQRAAPDMKWFQLRRTVAFKDHAPVAVLIDLLMPREAKFKRNKPPLLANFAVQKAHGAGVATCLPHRRVLAALNAHHILIAYQREFETIDNSEFFTEWNHSRAGHELQTVPVTHLPGANSYLIGTVKG